VRRNFVAERYAVLIEALYEGKATQYFETQVKYEDGRQGTIAATLRIEEAKVFAPQAAPAPVRQAA
jgi:long-chain acyl-CoA synthetase